MWLVLSAGDAWCDARMGGVQQMNVSAAVEYGKGGDSRCVWQYLILSLG